MTTVQSRPNFFIFKETEKADEFWNPCNPGACTVKHFMTVIFAAS